MKKRVISAIVALAIALPIIIQGGSLFYVFAILLSLVGLREMLNLMVKDDFMKVISYLAFVIIIGSNLFKTSYNDVLNTSFISIIFLIYMITMLLKYKDIDIKECFYNMAVVIFLAFAFSCIIITRNMGINYLLYIFVLTCMNDTFAHLFGSKFGKHKINSISPNKSWEGCFFGLFFGTLISTLFYVQFINIDVNIFVLFAINIILSVIGQLGDLFFSLIKRKYNVKDFSNLMPGHGGVLDRLDSLIFVTLAFTFFITFM